MIPSQLALDSSPSHRPCLIDYSVGGGSLLLILLVGLRQLSELVDAVLAPRILTAMDFLRCFSILQALGLSFHLSISSSNCDCQNSLGTHLCNASALEMGENYVLNGDFFSFLGFQCCLIQPFVISSYLTSLVLTKRFLFKTFFEKC